MPVAEDMENIVENIVSSYESRIQSIESILDTTHKLLSGFQDSFLDTKQEREKVTAQVREILAKNESLRMKDFDQMMQGILSAQDKREKEVRNLLESYLGEQTEMAQALRDSLRKFKNSLAKGEAVRVKEFQALTREILAKQEERKIEVTSKLQEFQEEQHEMAKRLQELLAKGRELRTRDFKSMLKEFEAQDRERLAHQKEREKEVGHLLGEFRKERAETARNWRSMQAKLAQRRTPSPKNR